MAPKSLYNESMKTYRKLKAGDLDGARQELSMIVGRDTQNLEEEEIAKACVETIAENTADGIGAPVFFFALGGPVGACAYKAINTMDSMVGYKNDKYLRFGYCAAKLDDVVNFIPSRLTAWVMIFASMLLGLNWQNAMRIYKRDRKNHSSPNSAQTESVCAGALGLKLGGDNYYFGKLVHKPTIGDSLRAPSLETIDEAEKLMFLTSFLMCVLMGALSVLAEVLYASL